MTNEEMERAIDFLLKSQANFEARLEQREAERAQRDARIDARFEMTDRQIAETNRQVAELSQQLAETSQRLAETNMQLGMFADTQADFIRVVTRTFEEQAHINKSVANSLKQLAEAQVNTNRRLDSLIDIVQGRINGG